MIIKSLFSFVKIIVITLFVFQIGGQSSQTVGAVGSDAPPPPDIDFPAFLPAEPDFSALAPLSCDTDGVQSSGAIYRICMPLLWNGDLLVYAHGYVSPTEPVGIPEDQLGLPGGPSLPDIANLLGYAFAVSSYSVNGLAVEEGLADLTDLVDIFSQEHGTPGRVLLVGVSEGGMITTLAAERYGDVFDGALALCGPYGGFRRQIDYFGDSRALFDYFFPDLLPPSPVEIPPSLIDGWDEYYADQVLPALTNPANAQALDQFLAVGGAAIDANDPATKIESTERLLWYSVHATNDASAKLGGQPFDNLARRYGGSLDDEALNQNIARFAADKSAVDTMVIGYETTGFLQIPLVIAHTAGDPIVPSWHAVAYQAKVAAAGHSIRLDQVTSPNYGHCAFAQPEVFSAFNRLLQMVNNPQTPATQFRLYTPYAAGLQ